MTSKTTAMANCLPTATVSGPGSNQKPAINNNPQPRQARCITTNRIIRYLDIIGDVAELVLLVALLFMAIGTLLDPEKRGFTSFIVMAAVLTTVRTIITCAATSRKIEDLDNSINDCKSMLVSLSNKSSHSTTEGRQ